MDKSLKAVYPVYLVQPKKSAENISCTPESSGALDKAVPCKVFDVNALYRRRNLQKSNVGSMGLPGI